MRRILLHAINVALAWVFLASATLWATDRNVDQTNCTDRNCHDEPNTPCCESHTCCTTTPCCTIQQGIYAASDGDTVLVSPGAYGQIQFWDNGDGKMIEVRSTDGPDKTTIGSTQAACVMFDCHNKTCLTGTQTLDGFRITGATSEAGIKCVSASPQIRNCLITENGSLGSTSGGGVYLSGCNATIEDSVICSNQAHFGGGIYSTDTLGLTVRTCLIEENAASDSSPSNPSGEGGGMLVYFPQNPNGETATISHCRFSGNSTDLRGGAIATLVSAAASSCESNHHPNLNIDNCLFENNYSTHGQGGAIHKTSCGPLTVDHITALKIMLMTHRLVREARSTL